MARLDIVLRFDKQIIQAAEQPFCMALKARDRWGDFSGGGE